MSSVSSDANATNHDPADAQLSQQDNDLINSNESEKQQQPEQEANIVEKIISVVLDQIYEQELADSVHFATIYVDQGLHGDAQTDAVTDLAETNRQVVSFVIRILHDYIFSKFDNELQRAKGLNIDRESRDILNKIFVKFVLFYYFLMNAWYSKHSPGSSPIPKNEFASNFAAISYVFQSRAQMNPSRGAQGSDTEKDEVPPEELRQIVSFFSTENNYKFFDFYDLLFSLVAILQLSDVEKTAMQKKGQSLTRSEQLAFTFLANLDKEYVNTQFFSESVTLVQTADGKQVSDNRIVPNIHMIVSTIVTIFVYENESKNVVDELLVKADFEGRESKFIVVNSLIRRGLTGTTIGGKGLAGTDREEAIAAQEYGGNLANLEHIYNNSALGDVFAKMLYRQFEPDTVAKRKELRSQLEDESYKLLKLFRFGKTIPIVDDFLRYHRDSDRVEDDLEQGSSLSMMQNKANMNAASFARNAKKSKNELVKINIISNKIRSISDLYSPAVMNNPELQKTIIKYLNSIVKERKGSTRNYYEEFQILSKAIKSQQGNLVTGKPSGGDNEGPAGLSEGSGSTIDLFGSIGSSASSSYSVKANNDEIQKIVDRVYFNFNHFRPGFRGVNLEIEHPLSQEAYITDNTSQQAFRVFRYSDIEFISIENTSFLDFHTFNIDDQYDEFLHNVGLLIGPLPPFDAVQAARKRDLMSVNDLELEKLSYWKKGKIESVAFAGKSSLERVWLIIKKVFIKTLDVEFLSNDYFAEGNIRIYRNYEVLKLVELNKELLSKAIYWIYSENDTDKNSDEGPISQEKAAQIVRTMLIGLYDKMSLALAKRLAWLIQDCYKRVPAISEDFIDMFAIQFVKTYNIESEFSFSFDNLNKLSNRIERGLIPSAEPEPGKKGYELPKDFGNKDLVFKRSTDVSKIEPLRIDATNIATIFAYLSKEERVGSIAKASAELPDESTEPERRVIKREKCAHELAWQGVRRAQDESQILGLAKYNALFTEFMNTYVLDVGNTNYICNICGMLLPIKQYAIDAKYDNEAGKYVTNTVPMTLSLRDSTEYGPYVPMIDYFNYLIGKTSGELLETNMFLRGTRNARHDKEIFLKNLIDLVNYNTSSNQKQQKGPTNKALGILDKYDLFVASMTDYVDLLKQARGASSVGENPYEVNKKRDNLILFFIFCYILELGGSQITSIVYDSMSSIYSFERSFDKLFSSFKIYDPSGSGTFLSLSQYPILCYLLFNVSYHFVRYNVWQKINKLNDSVADVKKIDLIERLTIIHSLVKLINNVVMIGKSTSDKSGNSMTDKQMLYSIILNKFFTQLNTTWRDPIVIVNVKQYQKSKAGRKVLSFASSQLSPTERKETLIVNPGQVNSARDYDVGDYSFNSSKRLPTTGSVELIDGRESLYGVGIVQAVLEPGVRYGFGASKGINKVTIGRLLTWDATYQKESFLTTCISGSYHNFVYDKNKCIDGLVCSRCGEKTNDLDGAVLAARTDSERAAARFKLTLQDLSGYKCPTGLLHTFGQQELEQDVAGNQRKVTKVTVGARQDENVPNKEIACKKCGKILDLVKSINNVQVLKYPYTDDELDQLKESIIAINRKESVENLVQERQFKNKRIKRVKKSNKALQELASNVSTSTSQTAGATIVAVLSPYVPMQDNLAINENEYVYLVDKVFVVKLNYQDFSFPDGPLIIKESDERIKLIQNHRLFPSESGHANSTNASVANEEGESIYQYTDQRLGMDVMYSAKTLALVAYKEKRKTPIFVTKTKNYLEISPSVANMFDLLTFRHDMIPIPENMSLSDKKRLVGTLIKQHKMDTATIVDFFRETFTRIKNNKVALLVDTTSEADITNKQNLGLSYKFADHQRILSKYVEILENFEYDDFTVFGDWDAISRGRFAMAAAMESNLDIIHELEQVESVRSSVIVSKDVYGHIYTSYLIERFNMILKMNESFTSKQLICRMIVECIMYLYGCKNTDKFNESIELGAFTARLQTYENYSQYSELSDRDKFVNLFDSEGHAENMTIEGFSQTDNATKKLLKVANLVVPDGTVAPEDDGSDMTTEERKKSKQESEYDREENESVTMEYDPREQEDSDAIFDD